MGFKEDVAEDLDNVIFDTDELAEVHEIDGQETVIVPAEEELEDAGNSAVNPKEHAINSGDICFFVRKKDISRKLTVNAAIEFDGRHMFVRKVKLMAGMYKLTIGAHHV